jgi:tripartite-type tricarboxylate transporter receptor subunit TctC
MAFKHFSRVSTRRDVSTPRIDESCAAKTAPAWLTRIAMLLAIITPCASFAQGYPSKPVRYVVRAPPGGTDDLIARLMQPALSKTLGQSVVVEYKPGAGGLVAWEYLSKLPPDGHSMLLAASGLAAIKTIRKDTTLDPFKDITWVSGVTDFMLVLLAHPSLPAKNVTELIAFAKKQKGPLSYGSSGIGATPHLNAEYFRAVAKIGLTHVPYKGAGPMYLDLVSGRIEMGTAVLGAALPHIRGGRVRALGVSGAKRSDLVPDVQTIGEALPGYVYEPFYAMVMAAGTPKEFLNGMADAMAKAMNAPEFRAQFYKLVGSPVLTNRPDEMLAKARKEAELTERIVRTAGITLE